MEDPTKRWMKLSSKYYGRYYDDVSNTFWQLILFGIVITIIIDILVYFFTNNSVIDIMIVSIPVGVLLSLSVGMMHIIQYDDGRKWIFKLNDIKYVNSLCYDITKSITFGEFVTVIDKKGGISNLIDAGVISNTNTHLVENVNKYKNLSNISYKNKDLIIEKLEKDWKTLKADLLLDLPVLIPDVDIIDNSV